MPMLDNVTKIDGLVFKLITALRSDGHTVTGTDLNTFKVTNPAGQSCVLPAKMDSNTALNIVRQRLNSIGIKVENKGGKLSWESLKITDIQPGSIEEEELFTDLFGFKLSAGSSYLLNQALAAMRLDLLAHIDDQIDAKHPSREWQTIAEEAERKLGELRKERDAAVNDLRHQRDEARKRAEAAEREIAEVRRSLSGLQQLFAHPGAEQ